jgi:hypothetical protein
MNAEPLDPDAVDAALAWYEQGHRRDLEQMAPALAAEVERLQAQEQRIRECVTRWAAFTAYADFHEAHVETECWHTAAEILTDALDGGAS